MVKKIIHVSDVHLRNYKRHNESKEQLSKFIDYCKEISSEYEFDEVRILIVGDLYHQKIEISNELNVLVSWFLQRLNEIAPTIIIAGNHDFLENNQDRLDSITPIIKMLNLKNVKYLDMISEYKSFCYVDDNITWCLYSIFDSYNTPDVKIQKIENPKQTYVGLFHGLISGTSNDGGYVFEHGITMDIFDGCDVVMCGDVHKRFELNHNGIKVVMPGSLIQQNIGENVSKHGFLVWDMEELEYEEMDLQSDYGYYKFKIKSLEEIDNQTEEFINF